MRLYLARHGEQAAGSEELSELGRKEVESVADQLFDSALEIDEIMHSVKVRARETAEILSNRLLPHPALTEREGLKPEDPVEPFLLEIDSFDHHVMIVGHLPFLERLLSTLLYRKKCSPSVLFYTSCVVCLERMEGRWRIVRVFYPLLINNSNADFVDSKLV